MILWLPEKTTVPAPCSTRITVTYPGFVDVDVYPELLWYCVDETDPRHPRHPLAMAS